MVKSANLGKEIVVSMVNKIGILADMARLIAEHGINIEAVAGAVAGNEAQIMVVTDDNLRAMDALKKAGYGSAKESEVVILILENKAGALKKITENLAAEGIDIKHIYGSVCSGGCPAKMIISTSSNEKALLSFKK